LAVLRLIARCNGYTKIEPTLGEALMTKTLTALMAAATLASATSAVPTTAQESRSGGHSERAQKSQGCGVAKIYQWRCGHRERLAAEPAHQAAEDDLPRREAGGRNSYRGLK